MSAPADRALWALVVILSMAAVAVTLLVPEKSKDVDLVYGKF
jgi:hypothetical protein